MNDNKIIVMVELCNYLKQRIENAYKEIDKDLIKMDQLKQHTSALFKDVEIAKSHLIKLISDEDIKNNLTESSLKSFIEIASDRD